MEEQLFQWITEHRTQDHCVSGRMIRLRALQITNDFYAVHNNFSASEGWFHRFLRRHKLALRRVTTSGRDLPSNVGQIIEHFLENSQNEFIVPNFNLRNVANMDETSNFI